MVDARAEIQEKKLNPNSCLTTVCSDRTLSDTERHEQTSDLLHCNTHRHTQIAGVFVANTQCVSGFSFCLNTPLQFE